MIANGYRVSFWGDGSSEIDCGNDYTTCEYIRTPELYTLNGWIIWYVNYVSTKLYTKRNRPTNIWSIDFKGAIEIQWREDSPFRYLYEKDKK